MDARPAQPEDPPHDPAEATAFGEILDPAPIPIAPILMPAAEPVPPPLLGAPRVPMMYWLPRPVAWMPAAAPPRPTGPRKPPVWTALVFTIIAIPITLLLGFALGVALVMIDAGTVRERISPPDAESEVLGLFERPRAVLIALMLSQAVFLAVAVCGTLIDRQRLGAALGWRRPRVSLIWLPVAMLGTLPLSALIQLLAWKLMQWLQVADDPIEHMMARAQGADAWLVIGAFSLVPGIVEETLFRGYLQRRLLMHWHPLAAVLTASVLFAVAHIIPVQVIAVFPLGIWLGFVAWRTGSIWFPMACHAGYNCFGLGCLKFMGWEEMFSRDMTPILLAWEALTATAMVAFAIVLIRARPGPIDNASTRRQPDQDHPVPAPIPAWGGAPT